MKKSLDMNTRSKPYPFKMASTRFPASSFDSNTELARSGKEAREITLKPVDLSTIKYNIQTCRPRNTNFKPVDLLTIKYNIETCRPVDQEMQFFKPVDQESQYSNLSTCRPRNTTFKLVDLSTKQYNIQTCRP